MFVVVIASHTLTPSVGNPGLSLAPARSRKVAIVESCIYAWSSVAAATRPEAVVAGDNNDLS